MYQALYRKYRPNNLNDVVGQKIVVKTLFNAIKNNKITHAYLFTGPRGTGKTSVAKVFAKLINCENANELIPCENCLNCIKTNEKQNTDIIEIDAASNNGVDEIREIKNKISLVPTYGIYKIYIIDEVHMLTTGAFNALLKTLEEPPQHVIFILATTEPYKIPTTILSRCQRFDFRKISDDDIIKKLSYICEKENIKIEQTALSEIANLSDGGMRDSIGLLDQVFSYCDIHEIITEQDVHDVSGTLSFDNISNFINLICQNKLDELLILLNKYDQNGINIKKFTEQLIRFFEEIILSKQAPEYLKSINLNYKKYHEYKKITIERILHNIELLSETLNKIVFSTNPKILLEICLIRMIGEDNISESGSIEKKDNCRQIKNKPQIVSKVHKQKTLENYEIKNYELYLKLKSQRINNVLSDLDKSRINDIKKNIEKLKYEISDSVSGKYISLLLDSEVKAASKDGIIVVFEQKSSSENFNENIPIIEKILNSVDLGGFKIISTYIDDWNIIKSEFNGKQKKYEYDFKIISEDEVYEKTEEKENSIHEVFDDFIEYI